MNPTKLADLTKDELIAKIKKINKAHRKLLAAIEASIIEEHRQHEAALKVSNEIAERWRKNAEGMQDKRDAVASELADLRTNARAELATDLDRTRSRLGEASALLRECHGQDGMPIAIADWISAFLASA